MRKYRLTRITVKTKEIILTTRDQQHSICPHCHHLLSALLPANESSAVAPNSKKPTVELPPAKVWGIQ